MILVVVVQVVATAHVVEFLLSKKKISQQRTLTESVFSSWVVVEEEHRA